MFRILSHTLKKQGSWTISHIQTVKYLQSFYSHTLKTGKLDNPSTHER